MAMSLHKRRCVTKAILEIIGALSVTDAAGRVTLITAEKLLLMTNAELVALYIELEKALDSANITEPVPRLIEDVETIVMEVDEPGDD